MIQRNLMITRYLMIQREFQLEVWTWIIQRSRVIPSSSIVIPIHDEWILEYSNARVSRIFYKISDHSREENPFYSEIWTFYVAIYKFSQVKQCKTFDKVQGCSSCLSPPRLWPHWRKELCTTEILGGKNERQIFIKPIDSSLFTWNLNLNFEPIFLLHWNIYERKSQKTFWRRIVISMCISFTFWGNKEV